MANNRMTEGVGKKIVEALKMQTDVEVTPNYIEEAEYDNFSEEIPSIVDSTESEAVNFEENFTEDLITPVEEPVITESIMPEPVFAEPIIAPQINIAPQQFVATELDDFEIPSNVAVLKQLISKLPTGVTKQTGAMIIKQTMEALGISMKSVLQEAQQVQEGLNNSARECQSSILEHKKQINLLEKQAQKYQRQYAALNDIISLFVQTNI